MRELLQARRDGSERADLAIRTFANSIRKRIGSLAVTLGDVDALVYTAGMGENVPLIRELTGNLSALGAEIDDRRNESAVGERAVISTDESDVDILVVPTNEELRIARQSRAKLSDDR
jgi:acetate kinase